MEVIDACIYSKAPPAKQGPHRIHFLLSLRGDDPFPTTLLGTHFALFLSFAWTSQSL